MIHTTVEFCPQCGKEVGWRVDGLSSGLGASIAACPHCGETYHTFRREWADMTLIGRLRYVTVSAIYTFIGALFGSLAFMAILSFFKEGPFRSKIAFDFDSGLLGIASYASILLAIQELIIRRSLSRTQSRDLNREEYGFQREDLKLNEGSIKPPWWERKGLKWWFGAIILGPLAFVWSIAVLIAVLSRISVLLKP
jgi:predicted RNA-binding Zn-ribbon protein involved in translation (DUF1610 family)